MFEPRHWRYGRNRTPPRTGAEDIIHRIGRGCKKGADE
nr:MAG TPA: hypothetical protein [Caudoviricetes sp.]